jgi:hypothetical protein
MLLFTWVELLTTPVPMKPECEFVTDTAIWKDPGPSIDLEEPV